MNKSKTKHTPGPWRVHDEPRNFGCEWFVLAEGIGVASVWKTDDDVSNVHKNPESQANARLIAAAPDLLEACKAAENDLWVLEQEGWDHPEMVLDELLAKIRAAIGKAEGGDEE